MAYAEEHSFDFDGTRFVSTSYGIPLEKIYLHSIGKKPEPVLQKVLNPMRLLRYATIQNDAKKRKEETYENENSIDHCRK